MSFSQNIFYTGESVTLTNASTAAVTYVQSNAIMAVYTRSTGSTVLYWDQGRQKIAATESRSAVATAAGNMVAVTPQTGTTGVFNLSIGIIQEIVTDGSTGSIIKCYPGTIGFISLKVTESPSALQTAINAASPAGSFVTTNTNQTIGAGAAKVWTDPQSFIGGIETDDIATEGVNSNLAIYIVPATGAGQAGGTLSVVSNNGVANTGANPGGVGGEVSIESGIGGASVTGTAGQGGAVFCDGGNGGSTTGVGGVGGNGGNVEVEAGDGGDDTDGTAGTGGDGGHVVFTPGAGGIGNTNGAEGEVRLRDATNNIQFYVNSTGPVVVNPLVNEANIGTIPIGAGISVVENGTGTHHVTTLTLTNFNLGAIPGAANLALGELIYTLPAGSQVISVTNMGIALQGDAPVQADTPEVGIGSVAASGAVAVLGGTATFEDIVIGTAAADANGTVTRLLTLPTSGSPYLTDGTGVKAIHLNIADGWSGASASILATGTIAIEWTSLNI